MGDSNDLHHSIKQTGHRLHGSVPKTAGRRLGSIQPNYPEAILSKSIPFNKASLVGNELANIAEAVERGHISGDGGFTEQCQALIESRFGLKKALLTTSCTAALEMSALLCGIEPGDEVIMPSYTFVSTANAFALRSAKPVFVDIRRDTLNIDESLIESAVTERSRAIVPVHYAGVGCDMKAIGKIAERHGLFVIEDAAQGANAKFDGAYLGTIGDLGTYSFHETKNFVCGEGGAIVTNRAEFAERAEIIREKGTNRSQFFRGQVDKYTWVDIGSSYLPSDILAAFLIEQLKAMDSITAKRRKIYETYRSSLQPLADRGLLELPVVPEECQSNFHLFHVLTASLQVRTALIEHLKARGITAVFHYVPLHLSPMGVRLAGASISLPVTEDISERLLRLPLYLGLTDTEQDRIIDEIYAFFAVQRS